MSRLRFVGALALLLLCTVACASSRRDTDPDPDLDGGSDEGGGTKLAPEGPACFARSVRAEIATGNVEDVDIVFAVDNSESMAEEQAALAAQFPRLIDILASGDRDGDGNVDFSPASSLHLAVVPTDLGLPGVDGVAGCSGLGGDGLFNDSASPGVAGCSATTYDPPFLTFSSSDGDDPAQVGTDLACLGDLGVDGCTIEQPLESLLKSVWPASESAVAFVGAEPNTTSSGQAGPGAPNGDFLRDSSVIALVVVTDEEDCSVRKTGFLAPQASPNGIDTRCYYENLRGPESDLFAIDRYAQAFKALRPGDEQLVLFAGIVGVPARLTTPEVLADYDFNDPGQPEAYHDMLLASVELQERIDDKQTPDVLSDDGVVPSCDRGDNQRAYPPRRIIEVAKSFGANGVIQSICQDDLTPAFDAIIDGISKLLGAVCLPQPLVRSSDGTIDCEVTWELAASSGNGPTSCDDLPFLTDTGRTGDRGGALCNVEQLAVTQDGAASAAASGEGWYYDDFSTRTQQSCTGPNKQRIAFTEAAARPAGVVVQLGCFQADHYVEPVDRSDLAPVQQPTVGSPCEMVERNNQVLAGDEACVQQLTTGDRDEAMFCDDTTKRCVLACAEDGDCPEQWHCDDRAQTIDSAGRAKCAPGTCSAGPASASDDVVGDPCLTLFVPDNGFDDSVAYVEGNNPHCGDSGACLVYHLDGDPSEDCREFGGCVPSAGNPCEDAVRCAAPQEVEQRVYCTCRCDAPEGFAECACPNGFSCVDVLDSGPAEISGGYCVRDGTFVRD